MEKKEIQQQYKTRVAKRKVIDSAEIRSNLPSGINFLYESVVKVETQLFALANPVRLAINLLKRLCYQQFLPKRSDVLDLGCGQGGDLTKFGHQEVYSYVGVDFVLEQLMEARYRARTNQRFQRFCKSYKFVEADLTKAIIRLDPPVDVAVCQLALHYIWRDGEAISTFFQSVCSSLKSDGLLIITIVDAEKIPKEGILTHPYIHLQWLDTKRYLFSFPGMVHRLEEHVIFKNHLLEETKKRGLTLVDHFNCREVWTKLQKMRAEQPLLLKDTDWQVLDLYRSFIFRKD